MKSNKRASRIKNWSLGDIHFIPSEAIIAEIAGSETEKFHDKIPLANLSSNGLGLWIEDDRIILNVGASLRGVIEVPEKKYEVQLKVMRKSKNVYGCEFVKPLPELSIYLQMQFPIEEDASKLVNIKEEYLAQRKEGNPHWHSDGYKSELYYIESNGILTQYRLVHKEHEVYKFHHKKAHYETGGVQHSLPQEIHQEFLRFLNHISELPFEFRKDIENELTALLD